MYGCTLYKYFLQLYYKYILQLEKSTEVNKNGKSWC